MRIEYKKDLCHNYMVITEEEKLEEEAYCIRMIKEQKIEGILPLEVRRMDNDILYYYDITGKQSMSVLLERVSLPCDRIRLILKGILTTLERAYEYLLAEDDFILSPECIYLDIASFAPGLCYLSGYKNDSKSQMSILLEYLMNKVDYNDKAAVLIVYQLYAASKKEGFTLHQLSEVMNDQKQEEAGSRRPVEGKDIEKEADRDELTQRELQRKEFKHHIKQYNEALEDFPIMMERMEQEQEILVFPLSTYILTGVCALVGILIVILGFTTRLLYNSIGSRIAYDKLAVLILILLCGEGYLIRRLWDGKNKLAKIVTKKEYVDPREDVDYAGISDIMIEQNSMEELQCINEKENSAQGFTTEDDVQNGVGQVMQEEGYNPTCLLNPTEQEKGLKYVLKSLYEEQYPSIPITEFPFFIGKLKKNVDYCIEKDVISRFHAKITGEGDAFFLTDLNSKNGTFINRQMLSVYEPKEIRFGDEIAFANMQYQFLKLS